MDCNNKKPGLLPRSYKVDGIFDLLIELRRMGLTKEQRNSIIEDITEKYGRGAVVTGTAFYLKDSDWGFDFTGASTQDRFAKKRKIEFKEHKPYIF